MEWISVKDKTPKPKDKMVLAYYSFYKNHMRVGVACVSGFSKKLTWHSYQNREIVKVTHWMPLPQPPKDNENEY